MAILVGTNTALLDNPSLTTRLWPGRNPIRLVVDMNLRLPAHLNLFNGEVPVIIFNKYRHTIEDFKATLKGVNYYQVTEDVGIVYQMIHALYHLGIQSVLVEGGAQLLQSFLDEGQWTEARVITNDELEVGEGLSAPVLKNQTLLHTERYASDTIRTYSNKLNR